LPTKPPKIFLIIAHSGVIAHSEELKAIAYYEYLKTISENEKMQMNA